MTTIASPTDIRGEILSHLENDELLSAVVMKYCPYCAYHGQIDLTKQVAVRVGMNNIDYTCIACSSRYYHTTVAGEDQVFRYVPEASLLRITQYKLHYKATGYQMLYNRAVSEMWFLSVDPLMPCISYGKWTYPIEAAAQLVQKETEGKGSSFHLGAKLRDNSEILLDADLLVKGLKYLIENGYTPTR